MKSVLFACIENSNRSQMAEAFAKIHGDEKVISYSAGSKSSGIVNAKAIESMKMKGYDLSTHKSKSLEKFNTIKIDYLVTMGCGDDCPFIKADHRIAWNITDPRNLNMNEFNVVRDQIEMKVKQLIATIIENDNE